MAENIRYGHYNELATAGVAYLTGKISRGLFEETINRILVFVRDGKRQFQAIQLPPELKKIFQEDMEKARKGFWLFEQGIEKMRKAVDEERKKEEVLWQGIGLVKFGCDLLNEVMIHYEKLFGNGDEGEHEE
jgi:hypothetical protein